MKYIQAGETVAARRRVYFHLVGTDGVTPATGEAGGQPQISSDGASWTGTGIGTLTHVGNGRYYADLTTGVTGTAGVQIETRYKSASTAEIPGDTVLVVSFDPYEDLDSQILARLLAAGLTVQVSSVPPPTSSDIELVAGQDYATADGDPITINLTTELDLSAASVDFVLFEGSAAGSSGLARHGCTLAEIDGGYSCTFGLTAAQTAAYGPARRYWRLEVELASGRVKLPRGGMFRCRL